MKLRTLCLLIQWACATSLALCDSSWAEDGPPGSVERGRYVAIVANCMSCHTAGFVAAGGSIPEDTWFTGSLVGFRSQVGTTYAPNLRLYFQQVSEDEWLSVARSTTYRRPMPWWSLREMTDDDLVAIYRYVRSMGPKGTPAPSFLPPGQEPPRPYIDLPSPPSR